MNIVIDVDDVHLEEGFGYNDEYSKRIIKLIEEFDAKFTLFTVSNWEQKQMLLKTKRNEWDLWHKKENIEIANHGLTHWNKTTKDAREFKGLPIEQTVEHLTEANKILEEFTGEKPSGFRPPGWALSFRQMSKLYELFDYVALNLEDKEFKIRKGEHGNLVIVPYHATIDNLDKSNINMDTNVFILHSHISPGKNNQNTNGWTEENYQKVRKFLRDIPVKNFKTMKEIVEDKDGIY